MSKRFLVSIPLALVLALCVVLGASADNGASFNVKPGVYDPGHTGIVTAAWVTHQGLPDAGSSDHALFLQKNGPTAADAAAGADVTGVSGITLTELGFDYRNDGHCGAGAPRFNVTTTDNVTHFFGCIYGTHTPVNANWTRVRFTDANAYPPVTADETVQSIQIVFDEGTDVGQGFVYLDNIDINGTMIGKPGTSK